MICTIDIKQINKLEKEYKSKFNNTNYLNFKERLDINKNFDRTIYYEILKIGVEEELNRPVVDAVIDYERDYGAKAEAHGLLYGIYLEQIEG